MGKKLQDVIRVNADGGIGALQAGEVANVIEELMATDMCEIVARAQRTIEQVEAGDAAGVGLEQAAALSAVVYELILSHAHKINKRPTPHGVTEFTKLGNLHSKLMHQMKQSAAWAYRVKHTVTKDSELGRNDSRVQGRILRRATTTADGCFDETL
ncbi:hypothetical protein LVJ83_00670 [Uruburuella testudinis]|uniref:Uncharacterized protein n=1 Tax=Uruburuella testudinis TaxID=1282863 RepID=A0ABY4DSL4_9NEIS|nr:hypothetical protein [Uruburuella testudinis]UOO82025.1 hypothetical protein LVJ83_00670 [Uruburuella testudinis]